jgi:hypothetical protein
MQVLAATIYCLKMGEGRGVMGRMKTQEREAYFPALLPFLFCHTALLADAAP